MNRLPRTFGCPVELSLESFGGKWKAVILARLKDGALRYGELRRLIPQLSDKVLTESGSPISGRRGWLCRAAANAATAIA